MTKNLQNLVNRSTNEEQLNLIDNNNFDRLGLGFLKNLFLF